MGQRQYGGISSAIQEYLKEILAALTESDAWVNLYIWPLDFPTTLAFDEFNVFAR
jgi:hypothetical protein